MSLESSGKEGRENHFFETREHSPGVLWYVFEKLVIMVDSSMVESPIPILGFAPYEGAISDEKISPSFSPIEGVDMEYIAECLNAVVQQTGIHTFAFHPYGDDRPNRAEKRSAARMRLFEKVWGKEAIHSLGEGVYTLTV